MPTTAADFLDTLPTFRNVDPATLTRWLGRAVRALPADMGEDTDDATIFMAAHLMSLAGIGPEASAKDYSLLESLSSGDIRLSFRKDDGMGDYGKTSYGRLLWPILSRYSVGVGFMVTAPGDVSGYSFTTGTHGEG